MFNSTSRMYILKSVAKCLIISLVVFSAGCGTVFIRSPDDAQTNITSPFTLQAQKDDQYCSFVNNSFRAYLNKGQPNETDITSAFTRPADSNIWTAQSYPLPVGNHRLSVEARFSGGFCGSGRSDSDSRQLTISSNTYVASFTGIGILPGQASSRVTAISDDGAVVVGASGPTGTSIGEEAIRWTRAGGISSLGRPGTADSSRANAVSNDGSVIVGRASFNTPSISAYQEYAYSWTASGGWMSLGDLPGGFVRSSANGVSGDGSVIVGSSSSGGVEAFRWTSAGMVGLGDFAGGVVGSGAAGVSDDGSIVVGGGTPNFGSNEAFRWTSGGMISLGDFPSATVGSYAYAVSDNGNVIVGIGSNSSGVLGESEAFRWVANATGGQMYHLGFLPGHTVSAAYDVSADGATIVGMSRDATGSGTAFRWTIASGMQSIASLLAAQGVSTSGWKLNSARGVSADGKTIVGDGINPAGNDEGWVAVIP